jgi:hypothetical protein
VICFATTVQQDGLALEYVPYEEWTAAVCTATVRQDGWALGHVPEGRLRSVEVCKEAVQQNGIALYFVPVDLVVAVRPGLQAAEQAEKAEKVEKVEEVVA